MPTTQQPITEKQQVHPAWYTEARQQTLDTLPAFLRHLVEDYTHDYGTICHAVAAAAVAAAQAINASPTGGITGFQAGAVMWEFITAWQGYKGPMRLVQYEHMLYPQYASRFALTITPDTWTWLQQEAATHLTNAKDDRVATRVADHWRSIVAGQVPFGYHVEED